MEIFVNKHIKRLYIIGHLMLFITFIINLFLGTQLQHFFGRANLSQEALISQQSLLYALQKTENIFRDFFAFDASDSLENEFALAKKEVYASYDRIKNSMSDDPENLESLLKIKLLIDKDIDVMNEGIERFEVDQTGNKIVTQIHLSRDIEKEIGGEITKMREREERESVLRTERSNAAFHLSGPATLVILLTISLLSFFSLVMRRKKQIQQPAAPSKQNLLLQASGANTENLQTIVHEIKNPLNNITMACSIMEENGANAVVKEMIIKNSKKIDLLVAELLHPFTDNTPLRHEEVLTKDLIEETLSQVDHKINYLNIKVLKHYHDEKCTLLVDTQKLKIIILNLIINAIEAMNKEIKILTIATKPNGGRCQIEISDNGIGMNRETIKKIFLPHYTSKKNGSGLGLTNSQNLIRKLGGEIEVKSHPGKGTTFTITF